MYLRDFCVKMRGEPFCPRTEPSPLSRAGQVGKDFLALRVRKATKKTQVS